MKNLLNAAFIFLIVAWTVGFFTLNAGSTIHSLLVLAAITIVLRIIKEKKIL